MGGYAAYKEQCPFEQKYGLYETIRLSNIYATIIALISHFILVCTLTEPGTVNESHLLG